MRYVIGVCLLTGMIVWDGVYYDGRYLDMILRTIMRLFHMVGIQ